MAVGNTGEYLEQAADAMCTWLSRDGGATWEDVAPYASIYECACAPFLAGDCHPECSKEHLAYNQCQHALHCCDSSCMNVCLND